MIKNEELVNDFIEEAKQHLEIIEIGLLEAAKNKNSSENINNIFRSIHSIKGTAGFFGFSNIIEISHSMESLLDQIRNKKLVLSDLIIDALLDSNDLLLEIINASSFDTEENIEKYIDRLESFSKREKKFKNSDVLDESIIYQEKEDIIKYNLKHGHKIYKVRLHLKEELDKENENLMNFFQKIFSIGDIIDSFNDIDEKNLEEKSMTFIFTTVLEKKLLPLALNISESLITEVDSNLYKSKKLKDLHKEDITKEESLDSIRNNIEDNIKNNLSISNDESIRVNVNLLNELLNLSSEMVLNRNQLMKAMESHKDEIDGIKPILHNIDRLTTNIQEKTMQTRMQSIGNIFNKLPRLVRDLSKSLDKSVELKTIGEDVELDKSIIESISDPLNHLIRNAIGHGLEKEEDRKNSGKPLIGNILVKAYHKGGHVNIEIIDDGRGIDCNKIKSIAIKKKLVDESEIENMDESQILEMIFEPGFSTSNEITNISGRGVGMDVVKTNIEKLGGSIDISTKLNKGTNITLILPITLAIVPSIIIKVGEHKFAMPQINIQEVIRIKNKDIDKYINCIDDIKTLRLRDDLISIINLGDLLKIENNLDDSIIRILILKSGNKRFGLIVSEIYDEEEILVKPLPKFIKKVQAYSGVTILGDGQTAMILDIEGIIRKSNLRFNNDTDTINKKYEKSIDFKIQKNQNILLFKSFGNESLAVDLSKVLRIEEIKLNQIEYIGSDMYFKYNNSSIKVIQLGKYIPIKEGIISGEKLYLIIPKSKPIGILVKKIENSISLNLNIDENTLKSKGITGTSIIDNKIVLLVNINDVLELVD